MSEQLELSHELEVAQNLAEQAGDILLKYFKTDLEVQFKVDKFDPVTQADKETDQFIRDALSAAFPNDLLLSEENPAQPDSYTGRVWMIDPLDGTKDFVAGRDCFSTIIGLLDRGVPVLGVVYLPARRQLFFAQKGAGTFLRDDAGTRQLHVSQTADIPSSRLITRWPNEDVRPLEEVTSKLPFVERIQEGSVGTKIAMIAEGRAEAYIQTTLRSAKWDTLGSQVILEEAGGIICDINGKALDYTKPLPNWDQFFVCTNNVALKTQILAELRPKP